MAGKPYGCRHAPALGCRLATRKFRGAESQVEVKNPSGICKGVKQVPVDGKVVAGNVMPFEAGKKVVKVEITLEA